MSSKAMSLKGRINHYAKQNGMYNAEVLKTNALVNVANDYEIAANDYEIACRIRKFVEHVSELLDSTDPEKQECIRRLLLSISQN